jgi:hypothetical protein
VTRALEARAADDAEALMERLAPLVVADSVRGPASAQTVLDVALLVDDEQADAFEEHLEGLAEAVHERLRLRLLGPVAPYDFVGEL